MLENGHFLTTRFLSHAKKNPQVFDECSANLSSITSSPIPSKFPFQLSRNGKRSFPLPLFLPLSFQIHTQFLIHASLSTKHLALPRFLSPLIPLFYSLCSPALSWPRSYDSTCLAQHALSDSFMTCGNKSLSSALSAFSRLQLSSKRKEEAREIRRDSQQLFSAFTVAWGYAWVDFYDMFH